MPWSVSRCAVLKCWCCLSSFGDAHRFLCMHRVLPDSGAAPASTRVRGCAQSHGQSCGACLERVFEPLTGAAAPAARVPACPALLRLLGGGRLRGSGDRPTDRTGRRGHTHCSATRPGAAVGRGCTRSPATAHAPCSPGVPAPWPCPAARPARDGARQRAPIVADIAAFVRVH